MEKWIRLDGLRLDVSIGIHDFEKTRPQPYKLDIGLRLVDDYQTMHDSIVETVDYDALRSRVSTHLASTHFNIQETVIQDVIRICFHLDPRIISVDVRTAKTSVYPDCDAVGLHYMLNREEWNGIPHTSFSQMP
ncbi:MAG: dihydroneopterin aldolase [Burkholderiales bacterium]|nr:dihydroneopterin aldolase [Burkholderiales bacterium]